MGFRSRLSRVASSRQSELVMHVAFFSSPGNGSTMILPPCRGGGGRLGRGARDRSAASRKGVCRCAFLVVHVLHNHQELCVRYCVYFCSHHFVNHTPHPRLYPPPPPSLPHPPPPHPSILASLSPLIHYTRQTPPTFTARRMRRRPPPTIPTTSRFRPSPLTTLPAPASPQPVFPRKAMRKSLRTPRGGRQRHHPLSRDAEGPKVEVAVTEALIRRQHTFPAPPALNRAVVAAVSTVIAAPRTVPPTTLSISWAVTTRRSRISRRR